MIKLITFDLDNTLWDVMPVILQAEKTMRAWIDSQITNYSEQITSDVMAELRNAAIKQNPKLIYNISDMRLQLLNQAFARCGVDPASAKQLAQQAFDLFMQGRNAVTLYEGAELMLGTLAKSYSLAALTNGNADVSVMPIARYFDFSMSPEQVQARKPESKIFAETLVRAGCSAQEAVHVGDHLIEDIDGAINAGWRAVWVNIGAPYTPKETPKETPKDTPDKPNYNAQVTRLAELPEVIATLDAQET